MKAWSLNEGRGKEGRWWGWRWWWRWWWWWSCLKRYGILQRVSGYHECVRSMGTMGLHHILLRRWTAWSGAKKVDVTYLPQYLQSKHLPFNTILLWWVWFDRPWNSNTILDRAAQDKVSIGPLLRNLKVNSNKQIETRSSQSYQNRSYCSIVHHI